MKTLSNSEIDFTRVWFLNVVITGIPDMGDGTDPRVVPTPALMLQDCEKRQISIIVGKDEAHTFKEVLEKHPNRTSIYETFVALLKMMHAEILGTFVHGLKDYRYLSKLRLRLSGSAEVAELDCRPSDAILLSVLSDSPIYMRNNFLEEFSVNVAEILQPR